MYDDLKNPVYGGGGAFAVHEVAKRLADTFDVTVLTGNYPHAKNETVDGVAYRRIGTPFFPGPFGQFLYHFVLLWHVWRESYDAWIESFTPPSSISFTPLFTKKPVIGLVHMLSGQDMQRKYNLPFPIIEKFGLKFYRHCIVITEDDARKIRMHNPTAHIGLIRNGVQMSPSQDDSVDRKYLSYIGRIEIDQKGIDMLLEAYAKIRKEIEMPLLIAGSGSKSEMARLETLIDRHGVRDSVRVLGRVEGKEKDRFFQKTMIGVIPSRYETFSLVALEMMSYGIPVVAFAIDGLKWAPEKSLVRVAPFDVPALVRSVVKLAGDSALCEEISKEAHAYAETRSWDAVSKEYERYITDVLAEEKQYE